jgi:hypothetical protein
MDADTVIIPYSCTFRRQAVFGGYRMVPALQIAARQKWALRPPNRHRITNAVAPNRPLSPPGGRYSQLFPS